MCNYCRLLLDTIYCIAYGTLTVPPRLLLGRQYQRFPQTVMGLTLDHDISFINTVAWIHVHGTEKKWT